jgi:hypothetical protein
MLYYQSTVLQITHDMGHRPRRRSVKRFLPDYPTIVLVGLVIVVGATLVFAASTSTVAFGVYNPSWDGTSELRSQADAADLESDVLRDTNGYTSTPAEGTLAVILSPQSEYGPAEADRLASFVQNGGTLLVAGNTAYANDVLASIGANARFDGRLLRDDQQYYRSPALPIAPNVSSHRFTAGVERLTLNHGTAVVPNNSTVLINSSEFAYLDTNSNGEIDDNESLGTRAVVTIEQIGNGRVVAVSDPSIFINTMLERSGNRAFIRALFQEHERLLLDYSHAGELPPLAVALLVLRDTPLLQFVLGCIGIAVVGVAVRLPELLARVRERWTGSEHTVPGAAPEELAAVVRQRHPDWDEERVQRVIQAIISRREKDSTNERS